MSVKQWDSNKLIQINSFNFKVSTLHTYIIE